MRWRDAPAGYGPNKTIYNRFTRWSRLGVFNRIFFALAANGGSPDRLMIDATHFKAHRASASLLKKGSIQTYGARRKAKGLRGGSGNPQGDLATLKPAEDCRFLIGGKLGIPLCWKLKARG